jgi:3-hydroxybutyryl-CoA dehydrogenase
MKILIVGESHHAEECKAKLGTSHSYSAMEDHLQIRKQFGSHDLIFDFLIDEEPEEFEQYTLSKSTVFLNTAKMSLGELSHQVGNEMKCTIFGFNGLPTFFNRNILEVSVLKQTDVTNLEKVCKELNTDYLVVDDRVGLVTPRVICMIINEAYYTVQEGTASREDIDTAMKLGTNYPFGPFEWCQRIGVRHVYELLAAVYDDTKDERYKICPLLKKEYLAATT